MLRKDRFCILVAVLLLFCYFTVPALGDEIAGSPNLSVASGSHSLDAQFPLLGMQEQVKNAKSIVLYELNTKTLLYTWNADAQMYPASLVKIMTALIAVEKGKMDDVVVVKKSVIDTIPYDAMSADLQADEVLSLEELLYCMLVDSANDAAAVIADHISGSQDAFVQEMNNYAQALGCTGTQFVNAHGLHNDQQYTTARDMAKILEKAMGNEIFTTIYSTINYTIAATNKSEERILSSGNFLMNTVDGMEIYYDTRVSGGRTGVTTSGDRCLAVTAEDSGLKVISILMGAESEYVENGYAVKSFGGFNETKKLLDLAFSGLKPAQVLYDGQILTQYSVIGGDSKVYAGVNISASTVLPDNITEQDLSYRYTNLSEELNAPIDAGQKLSDVQVWYGGLCVAQAELYAMNSVHPLGTNVNAEVNDGMSSGWIWVIVVVIIVALLAACAVLVLYLIGRIRIISARNRSKRYRRGRRRSR